ncbi:hypothetical protein JGF61_23430 [Salmonella enterica subsp. enterica serovar Agona]|nr:hypothetical protein [Salmonella enterica subsp. enterica serovar Agona]
MQPTSYRPISLLPALSKVFESLIHHFLEKFLTERQILQDEQFGFRKKHSTTHQLMRIVEDRYRGFSV